MLVQSIFPGAFAHKRPLYINIYISIYCLKQLSLDRATGGGYVYIFYISSSLAVCIVYHVSRAFASRAVHYYTGSSSSDLTRVKNVRSRPIHVTRHNHTPFIYLDIIATNRLRMEFNSSFRCIRNYIHLFNYSWPRV